jgi:type II secretory pathway pseudopilin PulG
MLQKLLMIVIAIIGILAAIAIPNFISYRRRSYNSAANSDCKNAYTSSQAYFIDYPTGTATLTALTISGFRQTANVTVTPSGTLTAQETGRTRLTRAEPSPITKRQLNRIQKRRNRPSVSPFFCKSELVILYIKALLAH